MSTGLVYTRSNLRSLRNFFDQSQNLKTWMGDSSPTPPPNGGRLRRKIQLITRNVPSLNTMDRYRHSTVGAGADRLLSNRSGDGTWPAKTIYLSDAIIGRERAKPCNCPIAIFFEAIGPHAFWAAMELELRIITFTICHNQLGVWQLQPKVVQIRVHNYLPTRH